MGIHTCVVIAENWSVMQSRLSWFGCVIVNVLCSIHICVCVQAGVHLVVVGGCHRTIPSVIVRVHIFGIVDWYKQLLRQVRLVQLILHIHIHKLLSVVVILFGSTVFYYVLDCTALHYLLYSPACHSLLLTISIFISMFLMTRTALYSPTMPVVPTRTITYTLTLHIDVLACTIGCRSSSGSVDRLRVSIWHLFYVLLFGELGYLAGDGQDREIGTVGLMMMMVMYIICVGMMVSVCVCGCVWLFHEHRQYLDIITVVVCTLVRIYIRVQDTIGVVLHRQDRHLRANVIIITVQILGDSRFGLMICMVIIAKQGCLVVVAVYVYIMGCVRQVTVVHVLVLEFVGFVLTGLFFVILFVLFGQFYLFQALLVRVFLIWLLFWGVRLSFDYLWLLLVILFYLFCLGCVCSYWIFINIVIVGASFNIGYFVFSLIWVIFNIIIIKFRVYITSISTTHTAKHIHILILQHIPTFVLQTPTCIPIPRELQDPHQKLSFILQLGSLIRHILDILHPDLLGSHKSCVIERDDMGQLWLGYLVDEGVLAQEFLYLDFLGLGLSVKGRVLWVWHLGFDGFHSLLLFFEYIYSSIIIICLQIFNKFYLLT